MAFDIAQAEPATATRVLRPIHVPACQESAELGQLRHPASQRHRCVGFRREHRQMQAALESGWLDRSQESKNLDHLSARLPLDHFRCIRGGVP